MSQMQPEFSGRLLEVFRAIDDVLVAHHTLRASLRAHPPLGGFEGTKWVPAPLELGFARYGEGPLFALWIECRAVEALRVAWTGKETIAAFVAPETTAPPTEPAAPEATA